MPQHVQPLEERRLFAGLITIDTTGVAVIVRGDGADNFLAVGETDPAGDGTPSGGWTFGTDSGALYVDGVEHLAPLTLAQNAALRGKPWDVDFGDGSDYFLVTRYEDALRSISVNLGDGKDYFGINSQFYAENIGAVSVDAGAGDDTVQVGSLGGNLSIFGGPGRDRVLIGSAQSRRTRLLGKLQVLDTQGPTRVDVTYADVRKEASIVTGNSIDRVAVQNVAFSRSLVLATHGGNDILVGVAGRVRGAFTLSPGAGRDEVNGFDDMLARA